LRHLDPMLPSNSKYQAGASKAEKEKAAERKRVAGEFRRFLEDHYDILDQATTFGLISSHGRSEELVHYAEVIGDRDGSPHPCQVLDTIFDRKEEEGFL